MNPGRGGWVIALSVMLALLLAIFHMPQSWPEWLTWWRPSWLLLVLFFWVVELPHRIGLFAVWLIGIVCDALFSHPLGLNGVLVATFAFLTWQFSTRLGMFSVVQQAGVLFVLVLGVELIRTFVLSLNGAAQLSFGILGIAFTSALIWPVVYLILLRVRIAARVE